jgi:hypothetical protein
MRISIRQYFLGFWKSRVLNADLTFLLTLLLLLNYRISFKLIALIALLLLKPKSKFSIDKVSAFYLSLIVIGFFQFCFVSDDHSLVHFTIVVTASLFWLASFWSFQSMRAYVEQKPLVKIQNSLRLLVLVNLLVSMYDIIKVMLITHTINPYTQVCPPPFGISSGDLVGGVFGGMHLVNTVISAFLFVYFLYRTEWIYVACTLIPFLLTGSNLATLLLGAFLIWIIVFGPGLLKRYYAVLSLCIIISFYVKITPSNRTYMVATLTKIANQFTTPTEKAISTDALHDIETSVKVYSKEELIELYVKRINFAKTTDLSLEEKQHQTDLFGIIHEYQKLNQKEDRERATIVSLRKDSMYRAKMRDSFFDFGNLKKFNLAAESGKITSFKQTFQFLKMGPSYLLVGNGPGSFSSRLAFVTSGIADDSRVLKALPHYETQAFSENHKAIFKYLMFLDDETHSITNLPFSSYNNLLGEYGIIGALLFVVFYLFYWLKNWKFLSYGRYLILLFLAFLFFDYWFERLSVVILFEVLMLINLVERRAEPRHE